MQCYQLAHDADERGLQLVALVVCFRQLMITGRLVLGSIAQLLLLPGNSGL